MTKILHKDLNNKHYRQWIKFLSEAETWDRKTIEKYQLDQLRKIITYAYNNTTGYKQLFDKAGVKPQDLRQIEDLQKFPFIEKEMIRDNLDAYSTFLREREYITTGGSTGIPFGFYRDPVSFAKELASKAYQYYRIGWHEGAKQLVLRGIPINTQDHTQFVPEFNELRCSSYNLTPRQMEIYRQKAWEYKPEFIKCYPSAGYIFARYLKESGKPFPRIKAVLCASENLYDFQKKLLHEVFGCRIYSHYGHYELAVLAGFCEHKDTHHVLPFYGYAELVDKKSRPVIKEGESGEIVATSFLMKGTPFIRYRTRDFATLRGFICRSCGRPYQIWDRIEGRLQEFIITKTGRYISMTAMNMHSDVFDRIKQFQYYQNKKGSIEFRFVPKDKSKKIDTRKIRQSLMSKLGKDITLVLKEVSNIPLVGRGKFRFLVQELKLEYGDA